MAHPVRHFVLIAAAGVLATVVTACGGSTESVPTATNDATAASPGSRTVDIAMEDIKYDQTTLTLRAGETIDFRYTNAGKIAHDAFIGDADAQMKHEKEMAEMAACLAPPTTPRSRSSQASPVSWPTPSTSPAPTKSAATNPATTQQA
jgi:uncharacterized cupredoxin-like copper-binding protein